MPLVAYVAALVSTAWRICVLLFLRILPSTVCKKILPPLWLLYITAWYLSPVPQRPHREVKRDGRAEPNGKTEEGTSSSSTPPADGVPSSAAPLITVVFSLPSQSRTLRTINFAINALLLLAAAEFALFPLYDNATFVTFTRVGAVYPDAANVVVRYPTTLHNTSENRVQVSWRQSSPTLESPWQDGPVLHLTAERDWVDTVRLGDLWPSTTYEYRLQNGSTVLPYPAKPIRFKTFPDPRLPIGSHFRFLVSSCTTPNFPYLPFQGRRIKGFDYVADYLWPTSSIVAPSPSPIFTVDSPVEAGSPVVTETTSPQTRFPREVVPPAATAEPELRPPAEFMLFLGDFIYADVPLYFGDDQGMYRQFYRRNYQSPSFRRVYEHLPIFHTYDDHDIKNNYVGLGNDTKPPFQNASNAYRLYSHDANYAPTHNDTHYYDFRYGDVAFFCHGHSQVPFRAF